MDGRKLEKCKDGLVFRGKILISNFMKTFTVIRAVLRGGGKDEWTNFIMP
jgi:hypothetical protein